MSSSFRTSRADGITFRDYYFAIISQLLGHGVGHSWLQRVDKGAKLSKKKKNRKAEQ